MMLLVATLVASVLFLAGLLIYLFRGPGSSGYYQRGRRYR